MPKELPAINIRFLQVLDYKGYTAYKLSKEVPEISQSKMTHIRAGRNKPSEETIRALLLKFEDINARWLLTGEGEIALLGDVEDNSSYDNFAQLVIANHTKMLTNKKYRTWFERESTMEARKILKFAISKNENSEDLDS